MSPSSPALSSAPSAPPPDEPASVPLPVPAWARRLNVRLMAAIVAADTADALLALRATVAPSDNVFWAMAAAGAPAWDARCTAQAADAFAEDPMALAGFVRRREGPAARHAAIRTHVIAAFPARFVEALGAPDPADGGPPWPVRALAAVAAALGDGTGLEGAGHAAAWRAWEAIARATPADRDRCRPADHDELRVGRQGAFTAVYRALLAQPLVDANRRALLLGPLGAVQVANLVERSLWLTHWFAAMPDADAWWDWVATTAMTHPLVPRAVLAAAVMRPRALRRPAVLEALHTAARHGRIRPSPADRVLLRDALGDCPTPALAQYVALLGATPVGLLLPLPGDPAEEDLEALLVAECRRRADDCTPDAVAAILATATPALRQAVITQVVPTLASQAAPGVARAHRR